MHPLISIIVPVYNVEKFVDQCIRSLTAQTYKNIEIILVDDGSTDSSGKICDSHKETDNRISVIHQPNSGVSAARNRGMSEVKGEYYCFIDGDDYVTNDYIEFLYEQIIRYDADISSCSFAYKYPDGTEKRTLCTDKEDDFVCCDRGIDTLENILYGRSVHLPSCCFKLYKKSAIGNIHFRDFKIGEDFLASLDFYSKAEKVVFSNRPLYYYIQNSSSAMHTENPEKYYQMVTSGEKIYERAIAIDPSLKTAASHYAIEMNMIVLMKLQYCENEREKKAHVKDNIKKYRKAVILDSKAKPRIRISCVISLLGFNILCKIRNAMTK